jgi:DNA primase
VVLLFDGDEAGQRAMERSLEVLLPAGLRVRAAPAPAGTDPDELLAREGADGAARADRQRARLRSNSRSTARSRAAARRRPRRPTRSRRSRPLLARIPSGVERTRLRRAARALGGHRGCARRGAIRARCAARTRATPVPIPVRHYRSRTARSGSSRAAWSIHPDLAGRVSREEMHELVPGRSRCAS